MTTPIPRASKSRIRLAAFGAGLFLTCGLGCFLVNEHLYSPFELERTAVPASPLVSKVTPKELPPPGGVDVSSVRVGQSYHFQGVRSGVTTVWRIQEITHDAICYEELTLQGGRQISNGTFLFPRVDPPSQTSLTKVGSERVEVGQAAFDCDVYEAKGVKSWSTKSFPGTIRTTAGTTVVRALIKIEQG